MAPTAKPFPRSTLASPRLNALGRYGLMTLLALLLFGVILLVSGKNPIQSYRDIFVFTLGSAYGFSEVLVAMIPMLITALRSPCPRALD
jgi:simple sugar transport system permease protein